MSIVTSANAGFKVWEVPPAILAVAQISIIFPQFQMLCDVAYTLDDEILSVSITLSWWWLLSDFQQNGGNSPRNITPDITEWMEMSKRNSTIQ